MNFQDVFDAHPKASELYVVDGMPFLDKTSANNYAGDPAKVTTVTREESAKAEAEASAAREALKAEAARLKAEAAAKAKADADAKAKAEADAKAKVG